jgi:hypothetical protein
MNWTASPIAHLTLTSKGVNCQALDTRCWEGRMTKVKLSLLAMPFVITVGALGIELPGPSERELPVEKLKAVFLECDQRSVTAILDFNSAALCSITYEQLLKRGFASDFNRLMDWWRANKKRE